MERVASGNGGAEKDQDKLRGWGIVAGGGPEIEHPPPNSDFTVRSLKGNMVLRWEYRPGSLLFLVWTQDRSESDPVADFYLQPGRVADARPENVFLIKASYYFTR